MTANRNSLSQTSSVQHDKGTNPPVSENLWTRPGVLFGCLSLAVLFFGLTSPQALPSVMLLVGFVMLGVLLWAGLRLVLVMSGLQARISPVARRAIVLFGTVLPVVLLMLQSIGQLTIRDVLTLTSLFIIGVFYISRARR